MRIEFGEQEVAVQIDSDGRALIDPPRRRVAIEIETSYETAEGGAALTRQQARPLMPGGSLGWWILAGSRPAAVRCSRDFRVGRG